MPWALAPSLVPFRGVPSLFFVKLFLGCRERFGGGGGGEGEEDPGGAAAGLHRDPDPLLPLRSTEDTVRRPPQRQGWGWGWETPDLGSPRGSGTGFSACISSEHRSSGETGLGLAPAPSRRGVSVPVCRYLRGSEWFLLKGSPVGSESPLSDPKVRGKVKGTNSAANNLLANYLHPTCLSLAAYTGTTVIVPIPCHVPVCGPDALFIQAPCFGRLYRCKYLTAERSSTPHADMQLWPGWRSCPQQCWVLFQACGEEHGAQQRNLDTVQSSRAPE